MLFLEYLSRAATDRHYRYTISCLSVLVVLVTRLTECSTDMVSHCIMTLTPQSSQCSAECLLPVFSTSQSAGVLYHSISRMSVAVSSLIICSNGSTSRNTSILPSEILTMIITHLPLPSFVYDRIKCSTSQHRREPFHLLLDVLHACQVNRSCYPSGIHTLAQMRSFSKLVNRTTALQRRVRELDIVDDVTDVAERFLVKLITRRTG